MGFVFHVCSWFIDFMKAEDQPSCIPPCSDLGSVGTLKYDWLKIAEMHVFAKSLAVAAFVMADTPVSWTFLNQNCRWKLMYMGNQLIVIEFHRRLFAGRKSTAAAVRSSRLNGYRTRGWPRGIFVSFYMLSAVVFYYPSSISNLSLTHIQVLRRRFLPMNH